MTWTLLAQTVDAGSVRITLQNAVQWISNDEIVIATTGGHMSQEQTEKRTIVEVSDNGRTLTLDQPLQYTHLGITGKIMCRR